MINLLTPREQEVAALVARAFPNKAIAREMKIAESTVKLMMGRIFEKLGVRNRQGVAVLILTGRPPTPWR